MLLHVAALVTAAICGTAAASIPSLNVDVQTSLAARQNRKIPATFKWTSTGPLIGPKNDGRNVAGIKDPTIVQINGTYHVFASTAQEAGYNLVYLNFTDFTKAGSAPFYYLDKSPIGTGYRAAPEVFYFAPQKLWYLVYQNGNAAYSTNKDIGNPSGWTAPKTFYNGTPKLIADNLEGGYWVDMWVICDDTTCHLFSSDDNGRLYRSQTSIKDFPNGMSAPVIAMEDKNKYNLFEAACIYRIADSDEYLLLIEAIGTDENRYFRSWTSKSISQGWTTLAATEDNSFARSNNVVFPNTQAVPWTKSISHGELIRTQTDQTLTIDPCDLRFLYQGLAPTAGGSYNSLPWKLGLITMTNPAC